MPFTVEQIRQLREIVREELARLLERTDAGLGRAVVGLDEEEEEEEEEETD